MVDKLLALELANPYPSAVRIVGVKIRDRGEVKKFDAGEANLVVGDRVQVDVAGELSYGVVYGVPQVMPFIPPMRVLQAIARKATSEDVATIDRYERLASEGMTDCRVNIESIKPKSVVLTDGTEPPADLIVYATGYGSMNNWLADLICPEVADRVGKVWGLGSSTTKDPGPWEGELRNMWKPTNQKQLWIHGGNLHQSRHYSQFLSLQLKARYEGLVTPVYGQAAVHHLR